MDLILEAKVDPERPSRTILTVDHFKEIMRFEEWLYRVEYPDVPGIPYKSTYKEPPAALTFYDMCTKDDLKIKMWPEETPDECRLVPSLCPSIRPPIK